MRAGIRRGLLLLLSLSLTLTTACANEESHAPATAERRNRLYRPGEIRTSLYRNGVYHFGQGEELDYYDAEKHADVRVCSRKNCRHQPWTEETLPEERCDAYLPGSAVAVFAHQEYLYRIYNDERGFFYLWRSNPDGSEAKKLCSLDTEMLVSGYLLDAGNLFYSSWKIEMSTAEPSLPQPDEEAEPRSPVTGVTVSVHALDLHSGEERVLGDSHSGKGLAINVLGAEDGRLFARLTQLTKDGENTRLESRPYAIDLRTGEEQELDWPWQTPYGEYRVMDGSVYAFQLQQIQRPWEEAGRFAYIPEPTIQLSGEVARYDMASAACESLGRTSMPRECCTTFVGDWIFRREADAKRVFLRSLRDGTESEISEAFLFQYTPLSIEDPWILVSLYDPDWTPSSGGQACLGEALLPIEDYRREDIRRLQRITPENP